MKLDENYALEHERDYWTIKQFNSSGNMVWQTYHVSCKQALEKYMDSKMKEVDGLYPIWVDELYKSIESSYAKLKDL